MKSNITREVEVCPECNRAYGPLLGDICGCVFDEPQVDDWEDHPFQPARKDDEA